MSQIKIAVMNTSKEITSILEEVMKEEGFLTCSTYTYLMKNDEKKFDEFIKENDPQVIIYDIAIPYEENYDLFKRLSKKSSASGLPFVLTTTNKAALEKLVGPTPTFEIIGKPYDLMEVIKAVKKAFQIAYSSVN